MLEQEHYISSFDGTELFTTSMGKGPTMVLCDGLGCDGFIWRYFKEEFKHSHQIIRWNYRGHGLSKSPADRDAIGMPALCADLRAVLDAYNVDSAILVGHSLGVQVILDFALEHPHRVDMLVPICGSYGRPLDTLHGDDTLGKMFPYLKNAMASFPKVGHFVWKQMMESKLAYKVATTFEVNGKILKNGSFVPYFQHLATMDPQVFMRLLDRIKDHTVEHRLHNITQPTLIVAGEFDTFTPAWLSEKMHQRIPNSELLMVPGGTHVAPIEIPELLHLRLHQFLQQQQQRAAA